MFFIVITAFLTSRSFDKKLEHTKNFFLNHSKKEGNWKLFVETKSFRSARSLPMAGVNPILMFAKQTRTDISIRRYGYALTHTPSRNVTSVVGSRRWYT